MASGDARSNSCSFPSASPTTHAQHGAVLQEMEMLAVSVQDRWLLVKAGTAPHSPDRLPGVVCLHLSGPEKGPQGVSLIQRRPRQTPCCPGLL